MEMWLRMFGSPVPTQTTLGSEAATSIQPIASASWSSKTGVQWVPPSVVLKIPPEAAPA